MLKSLVAAFEAEFEVHEMAHAIGNFGNCFSKVLYTCYLMYDQTVEYQEVDLEALRIVNMCYERAKEVFHCL